ncbi:hypothetical protein EV699_101223 [Plasticicumulans lactativorans]|uniref:SPFH domain/Band 7 family protein n=1 Tax=Plasticicumulans lactativorans TaxID=1133106 RepID=A0A4R2L9K2_9GAMM|nr:hypothetical protein [Plasticicumulans lactativorans]TCO83839.1 hypothetical protein EV699_101223 [Plasticicumulans lactativorans]
MSLFRNRPAAPAASGPGAAAALAGGLGRAIPLGLAALAVFALAGATCFTVEQGEPGVVLRTGAADRVAEPGLPFVNFGAPPGNR